MADILTMADVIRAVASQSGLKLPTRTEAEARAARLPKHKGCAWCAAEPPLAANVCGRFVVACENEDCPVEVQATGDTLDEVWSKWDARA